MTRNDQNGPHELPGEVVDEGTTGELLNDKMVADDLLREIGDEGGNVNDQPGFDDGRQANYDYEDREGEPNNRLGSDLGGEAEGGEGAGRSGGVDGGPERKTPLPG